MLISVALGAFLQTVLQNVIGILVNIAALLRVTNWMMNALPKAGARNKITAKLVLFYFNSSVNVKALLTQMDSNQDIVSLGYVV